MANTIDGRGTGRPTKKPASTTQTARNTSTAPWTMDVPNTVISAPNGQTKVSPGSGNTNFGKVPPPSPTPSAGGGGGGSVGTNATGQQGLIAPPSPTSDEDWWNSDAAFQAEKASGMSAYNQALAALGARQAQYDTDFVSALKSLGWNWGGAAQNKLPGMTNGVAEGSFDPNDLLGAYGYGLNNLLNDFASRGMLQSSFYDTGRKNFDTNMGQQASNLQNQYTAATSGTGGLNSQKQSAYDEYLNALSRAKASSLARRSATLGV